MASNGGSLGGIGLGGILVIAGILVAIFGSFWLGVIIALVGLIAFGGFAKGKWYCRSAVSDRRTDVPGRCRRDRCHSEWSHSCGDDRRALTERLKRLLHDRLGV